MRNLSVGFLITAIAAIVVALAISNWTSGLVFGGCPKDKAMIAVTFLIIFGLACLCIVLIIDIIMCCRTVIPAGVLTARIVVLFLGTASLLTGVLVFTARTGKQWSYFLTVVGSVFATLVTTLAATTSQCVQSSRHVVLVRQRA